MDHDARVMDTLLRMIVPFRREFGRMLDVKYFLHDLEYRQDIVGQALQAKDTRLREYAAYLGQTTIGPRLTGNPGPAAGAGHEQDARRSGPDTEPPLVERLTPSSAAAPVSSAVPGPTDASSKSAEELMRDRIMRKYTDGLR